MFGYTKSDIDKAAERIQSRLGIPVKSVTGSQLADLIRLELEFDAIASGNIPHEGCDAKVS